ncbi:hypothetical protein [Nocardia sp. NPDC004750]
MSIKSTLAKTVVAAGVVVGLVGIGTGMASADPGPDQRPPAPAQPQDPHCPPPGQPQGPDQPGCPPQ